MLTVQRGARTRTVRVVASQHHRAGRRREDPAPTTATKLGYVDLTSFTQGSGDEVRAQVRQVRRQGAKALILDLRENGGGLLEEAVNVASIFIPDGTIVSTDGRSQPRQVYMAKGNAIPTSIPLVVLVDHDTASAAEIVTGALQDRSRAKVVGTRTYGKGVFQEIQPLSNGGALDFTVGEYFTPNGQNLGGGGVGGAPGSSRTSYASTAPHAPHRPGAARWPRRRSPPRSGERARRRRARASRSSPARESSSSPSRSSVPGPGWRSAATSATTSATWCCSRPPRSGGRGKGGVGRRATIERRLGRPDVARDVIEALMLDRGLRRRFDPAVRARGARGGGRGRSAIERSRATCATWRRSPSTRSTARDFDDAISAEALAGEDGWRVWVHIADVAAYVPPRSLVDREAYRRATSVYVPGAVEPMLPARAVQRRLFAGAGRRPGDGDRRDDDRPRAGCAARRCTAR